MTMLLRTEQSRRKGDLHKKNCRVCVRHYYDSDSNMSSGFIKLVTDAPSQQYRVVIPRCKRLPPKNPNPHIGDGLVDSIVHLLRRPRP